MTVDYSAWVGATETAEDTISLAPALAAAATFDDAATVFAAGSPLPPLWHWFYFLPRAPQSRLGADGHPQRGGFMPPIELPRRMFAGGRLRFFHPLVIGKPATRSATIRDVSQKDGKTGTLAFVTVGYVISQDGRVCIEEEQDIVYREPGGPLPAPQPRDLPPAPASSWTRTIMPDPTLLFRFSALTFNAHRIHYDRDYATGVEGYPGLVVHGPLTAMLLMELVRLNARRPVTAYTFRGQAPLFDLAPFRLVGTPDAGNAVQLEAQGPDGRTAFTASAELD
ncbi:MAG: MaoC family dehydratase N-terminal domain-containing protein [Sterolibacteriaceae bacterium]|nr:MaoC family dehydratase N-terminal domain-containing protein [Sterolibacteriaceae bacterium]